jgi:hypothetical protein
METTKKYLIFIFGPWKVLEQNSEMFDHIKDVLETIIIENEVTFITGEHMLIANIKSHSGTEEVHKLMEEFLRADIPAFFIIPNSDQVRYRMNPLLEKNLFSSEKLNLNFMKNIEESLRKNLGKDFKDLKKMEELGMEIESINSQTPKTTMDNLNIDQILDKIHAHGIDSLNNEEKEFLEKPKK